MKNEKKSRASLNKIRISPRKLNLVAAMIRGLSIGKAVDALAFCRKRISGDVRKVVLSAIANAENNHGMDIDRLYVKEAFVGQSLVLKRFHARAKGRGAPIKKRFSSLNVVLAEKEDV